ncbi:WbqC family protein [Aeromonas caviae]|uniref:WbqC family protein n=1 Tax=Aeromonas caviae TaxID=648 RepID=UPI001FB9A171|nr:WbqC family protein [Aeromonas caviae]
MQPYIFPYIGYYQLVYAADCFIIYDDVTFIKQSYINRNKIRVNNQAARFSLPVIGASSNELIKNLCYAPADKLLKTIQQSYSKAPYYKDVIGFITSVFKNENRNIAKVNELSIRGVFDYLNIKKEIIFSSELEYDRAAERAERLIILSKIHGCEHYINSPGGKMLYDKSVFSSKNIRLSFIETKISQYNQSESEFIPCLSMIDILMNCSKKEIIEMLSNYELS